MSTSYEIPLTPDPQSFSIAMNNTTYNLTVKWNDKASAWVLDIADSNEVNIVTGIPLVTGTDLLGQYVYLGFGVQLYVTTDGDSTAIPTFENLGVSSHLYFTVM